MADRSEIIAVYAAGLIQGMALVTFPAASSVFMGPGDYGLSKTEYGFMFIPQVVMAIISSLLSVGLRGRLGIKRIFLLGLMADLLAMTLLVGSVFVMGQHVFAYAILLSALGCMGVGFGFTVPSINTFAEELFPQKVDRAVLVLNALLGLGTALAPVFIAVFVELGIWWGLPVAVGVMTLGLLMFSVRLALTTGKSSQVGHARPAQHGIPMRFWIYASFMLLYGVCETMNGNWAVTYLKSSVGESTSLASLTLAMFWGILTVGRIIFSAVEKWLPDRLVFRILPFIVAIALVAIAFVPKGNSILGILSFSLAGLGCSALLPLTISFCQNELKAIATSAAGGLIASLQIGYGIAAFGVGPLQTLTGCGLEIIYGSTAVVALVMSALSFTIARK